MQNNTPTPMAAGVSQATPLEGQKARSGPDFQFLPLPTSGSLLITITGSVTGIKADLMQDKSGVDKFIQTLKDGDTIDVTLLSNGGSYYIAKPDKAGGAAFLVTFSS
jgi:hypothetical protein